jgi:hypothetical protein
MIIHQQLMVISRGHHMVHVVSHVVSEREDEREFVGLGSTVLDLQLKQELVSKDNVLVSIHVYPLYTHCSVTTL